METGLSLRPRCDRVVSAGADIQVTLKLRFVLHRRKAALSPELPRSGRRVLQVQKNAILTTGPNSKADVWSLSQQGQHSKEGMGVNDPNRSRGLFCTNHGALIQKCGERFYRMPKMGGILTLIALNSQPSGILRCSASVQEQLNHIRSLTRARAVVA